MQKLIKLAPILLALLPAARAQLFFITGSNNQGWTERFGSALFAVEKGGKVTKTEDLVSQETGFFWIGMSYELKRAALFSMGSPASFSVLDLDKAEVIKKCELPAAPGVGFDRWLADVPGQRATVEILEFDKDFLRDQEKLYTMSGDPAVACAESLEQVALQQVRYVTLLGTSGVGSFLMQDGSFTFADPLGNVSKRMGPETTFL
jgi:hypothetical protein